MVDRINELRARAEAFLRSNPRSDQDAEKQEVSEIIHELSVYQIELEMQNNQLKLVQDELLNSNVSFYKLYNEAPVGYVIIDTDNKLIKANQAFLNYINATPNSVLKRPLLECFSGDSRLQLMAWMRSDKVRLEELELEVHDGERTRYLQVSSADVDAWNGQPCRFLVFTDITEQVEAQRELTISAAAINAASEGCFVVDKNEQIVFVNPALMKLLGYDEADVLGQHPRIFKSDTAEEDFSKRIWQEITRGNSWKEELWLRNKQGQDIVCMLRVSPISERYEASYSYVAMVSDITERKKFQDTIIRQATEDALTGLPNRTLLMDRLKQALIQAQRHGTEAAVLFMDLDGFKVINDTLGHNVGDKLLVQVADRLRKSIRESDTLARMGGDEFIFVINDAQLDGVKQLCEKVLESLQQGFELEGEQHEISASLGIAMYPEHSRDENELLRLADQAMYEAKRLGKAQCVVARTA
jgi:two-component system CheB/CheR fusion protein